MGMVGVFCGHPAVSSHPEPQAKDLGHDYDATLLFFAAQILHYVQHDSSGVLCAHLHPLVWAISFSCRGRRRPTRMKNSIELYEAWGKPEKAEERRAELPGEQAAQEQ